MSQIFVGTQNIPFSADRFPVTPDTMGDYDIFPKEILFEIFRHLNDEDLATTALVNWTCKEVVERNTPWGERKRFFRIFHALVKQEPVHRIPLQHDFPLERFCSERDIYLLPGIRQIFQHLDLAVKMIKLQDRQLHVVVGFNPRIFPMMTSYTISYLIYDIDLQTPYPHLQGPKVYFRYNSSTKSIFRFEVGKSPPDLEIHPTWMDRKVAFQDIIGKWLVVWHSPNNSSVKGTLHFLDKETLIEDFCYDFNKSPKTPLPPFETGQVYIQDKFCIVYSPGCAIIKMDGRTVRIDQETMSPLHRLSKITNFSCNTKLDGQMEISIEGETKLNDLSGFFRTWRPNETVHMWHMTDPFEPISTKSPNPPSPPSRLFKFLKWAAAILFLIGIVKWGHSLLRKAMKVAKP